MSIHLFVDMQDEVCHYILIHDVNVQNHTSRLKSLLFKDSGLHVCMCPERTCSDVIIQ